MRPDADMPEFLPQHDSAPWVPENAPTYKVGDRVRVTAGIAECVRQHAPGTIGDVHGISGHPAEELNQAGVVRDPEELEGAHIADFEWQVRRGHPILIRFWPGVPFRGGRYAITQDCFAISELELVDTADAPERREDKPFHPDTPERS